MTVQKRRRRHRTSPRLYPTSLAVTAATAQSLHELQQNFLVKADEVAQVDAAQIHSVEVRTQSSGTSRSRGQPSRCRIVSPAGAPAAEQGLHIGTGAVACRLEQAGGGNSSRHVNISTELSALGRMETQSALLGGVSSCKV
jgi:hypothetical protein